MIINRFYDERPFIEYKWFVQLSNGIIGKEIVINEISTNYIITEDGCVYNSMTENLLVTRNFRDMGYRSVNISLGQRGKYKTMLVHRLVGLGFIQNPENKPIINHKDGIKYNNHVDNLEWSTYSENNKHAFDIGLKKPTVSSSEDCILRTHEIEEVEFVIELLLKRFSPKYIIHHFGIDECFVYDIKNKVTWKEKTKNYDFNNIPKYTTGLLPDQIMMYESLFRYGYTVKEACDLLGDEYTERHRGRLKQIQKRIRKEISEFEN